MSAHISNSDSVDIFGCGFATEPDECGEYEKTQELR
jgi:hypothetical protein